MAYTKSEFNILSIPKHTVFLQQQNTECSIDGKLSKIDLCYFLHILTCLSSNFWTPSIYLDVYTLTLELHIHTLKTCLCRFTSIKILLLLH